jgi:hypothetical protein
MFIKRFYLFPFLFFIALVCSVITSQSPHAAPLPDSNTDPAASDKRIFQTGEVLQYKVTYLSIRLGTIVMKVDSMLTENGRPGWMAHAYIDSRNGIPFVSLHTVFQSDIDEGGWSRGFLASSKDDDKGWSYSKYTFDYPNKKFYVQDGKGENQWRNIEFPANTKYNEGLSLFFYARCNTMYNKYSYLPTVINDDTSHTQIHFLNERESQTIDAAEYPVDCLHFTGYASWTGLYGLTGKFEGWFSNDNASVPIKARMKLYLGSVWIELEKWNRPGWQPPRANS